MPANPSQNRSVESLGHGRKSAESRLPVHGCVTVKITSSMYKYQHPYLKNWTNPLSNPTIAKCICYIIGN